MTGCVTGRTRWRASRDTRSSAPESAAHPRRRAVEHLVLRVVDRLVEVLDRGQVLGDAHVEHVVEQVIGAVAEAVGRVALDVAAELLEDPHRLVVVRDHVVGAEEEVADSCGGLEVAFDVGIRVLMRKVMHGGSVLQLVVVSWQLASVV